MDSSIRIVSGIVSKGREVSGPIWNPEEDDDMDVPVARTYHDLVFEEPFIEMYLLASRNNPGEPE